MWIQTVYSRASSLLLVWSIGGETWVSEIIKIRGKGGASITTPFYISLLFHSVSDMWVCLFGKKLTLFLNHPSPPNHLLLLLVTVNMYIESQIIIIFYIFVGHFVRVDDRILLASWISKFPRTTCDSYCQLTKIPCTQWITQNIQSYNKKYIKTI